MDSKFTMVIKKGLMQHLIVSKQFQFQTYILEWKDFPLEKVILYIKLVYNLFTTFPLNIKVSLDDFLIIQKSFNIPSWLVEDPTMIFNVQFFPNHPKLVKCGKLELFFENYICGVLN